MTEVANGVGQVSESIRVLDRETTGKITQIRTRVLEIEAACIADVRACKEGISEVKVSIERIATGGPPPVDIAPQEYAPPPPPDGAQMYATQWHSPPAGSPPGNMAGYVPNTSDQPGKWMSPGCADGRRCGTPEPTPSTSKPRKKGKYKKLKRRIKKESSSESSSSGSSSSESDSDASESDSSDEERRRHRRRRTYKPVSAPEFSGKPEENIKTFMKQFASAVKDNRWSKVRAGRKLAASLKGEAADVLNQLDDGEDEDYDVIMEALKYEYDPPGLESKYSMQLMNKKFNSKRETVQSYASSLRRLAKRAYGANLPEPQLVDLFVRGMGKQARKWILLQKPTSLTQCVVAALTLDAAENLDPSDDDKHPDS